MKKYIFILIALSLLMFLANIQMSFAQTSIQCYTVTSGQDTTILIENGQLYRLTIKSCWYSAYARMGSYLIYGLNISDSKTNGKPEVLKVEETTSIDWSFSYSLSGLYDAKMKITSSGWGDQGLLIVLEKLKCN